MMPLFLAMNILLELGNALRGSRVIEAGVLGNPLFFVEQGLQVGERVYPVRSDR